MKPGFFIIKIQSHQLLVFAPQKKIKSALQEGNKKVV